MRGGYPNSWDIDIETGLIHGSILYPLSPPYSARSSSYAVTRDASLPDPTCSYCSRDFQPRMAPKYWPDAITWHKQGSKKVSALFVFLHHWPLRVGFLWWMMRAQHWIPFPVLSMETQSESEMSERLGEKDDKSGVPRVLFFLQCFMAIHFA